MSEHDPRDLETGELRAQMRPEPEYGRRREDQQPRYLLPILLVLIMLGSVSAFLAYETTRQQNVAQEQSVDRNARLIERLQEVADRNHSDDRLGHRCILDAIRDIGAGRPVVLPDVCDPIVFDQED